METQTENDELLEHRCQAMLLSIPWQQAGIAFRWPLDAGAVKRICGFLDADADDRMLQRYTARHPIGSDGWRASDVLSLAAWLNVRLSPPEGSDD